MKIKTFVFTNSIDEDEINSFIADNNADVVSLTFNGLPMHELFYDGNVANQWMEYIGVLIYK